MTTLICLWQQKREGKTEQVVMEQQIVFFFFSRNNLNQKVKEKNLHFTKETNKSCEQIIREQ